MKKISSIVCCFLFLTTFSIGNTQQDFDPINEARLDIVVINSYVVSETWSNSIVQKIEKRLREKYSNAYIHARNVGAAEEHNASSYFLSFRHIFHSFLDQQTDYFFQRVNWNDLFEGTIIPDLIVFLGNESFLFYQGASAFIPKRWIDIPVIWTCTTDSVIANNWPISTNTNFSDLCPPENRTNFKVNFSKKMLHIVPEINHQYITDTIFEPDTSFILERHYNLTGIKTPLPIKENLELIKTLYPKVNEIVFIDEGFYSTDYIHRKLEQEIPRTLPNVRFTPVKHLKNINTDSLFYLMTHPIEGKVFLTYSFNINAYFSKYSENTIDSLFQNTKIAPVFSLTNRSES